MGRRRKSENGTGEQQQEQGRPNQYDPAKVRNYVERIEALKADVISIMMKAVGDCRPIHADIKQILQDAKDAAGIPKKALRAAVKARELEAKARQVRDDLEEAEDQHSYDLIRHALGDLADTPLGKAALGDDERDLRPSHMRNDEASQQQH